jgi:hypothetical protein
MSNSKSARSSNASSMSSEVRRLAKPGTYSTSVDMAGGKSQRSNHRSSQAGG